MNSLSSVTTDLLHSLTKRSKKDFINEFGHVRPNTYDINSKSYEEDYQFYFSNSNVKTEKKRFVFTNHQKKLIEKKIKKLKLEFSFKEFEYFLKESIIQREKSKLSFTRVINYIFKELRSLSKRVNLNQKDLQYIDIYFIKNLFNNFSYDVIKTKLNEVIKRNKKEFEFHKNFNLPNVILDNNDIFCSNEKIKTPTFVTDKVVKSPTLILSNKLLKKDFHNKIVCITNADPGYDFIFSKNIKGLITEYGGPNSHMFIRCNELNLPAAIGVGKQIYDDIQRTKIIELDCKSKKITCMKI